MDSYSSEACSFIILKFNLHLKNILCGSSILNQGKTIAPFCMFSPISDLFIYPLPLYITSPFSPVLYYCTPWCNSSVLSVYSLLQLSPSIPAIPPVLLPLCMTQFSSSTLSSASVFLDYLCTVCLPPFAPNPAKHLC